MELTYDIDQGIYYRNGESMVMLTGKVFQNGRSQAIRLPKECRFKDDEVFVNKVGDVVLLIPKGSNWSSLVSSLDMFSDDFFEDGRKDDKEQVRELL